MHGQQTNIGSSFPSYLNKRRGSARHWSLWVRCPACRTVSAIELRTLDRHHDAAVASLIPDPSCRLCRPNAPFAELVRLSGPASLMSSAKSTGAEFLESSGPEMNRAYCSVGASDQHSWKPLPVTASVICNAAASATLQSTVFQSWNE